MPDNFKPNPVPMLAPDGTPGLADPASAQDLANKGYKPGALLRAPDGTQGVAKFEDTKRLRSQGYLMEGEYQNKLQMAASANNDAHANQEHQAAPAPSSVWGWMNAPVNLGNLRDNIARDSAYSTSAPTLDEAANHPVTTALKKGLAGFGADTAKMVATPLGLALTAAGPLTKVPGAVGVAAKALSGTAAVGFGAKAGIDVAQHPLPVDKENTGDYVARMSGNAAMLLGAGATGLHVADSLHSAPTTAPEPQAQPLPPESPSLAPEAIDPKAIKAAARVAQAVGGPQSSKTQTVNVDPEFAQELTQWQNSDLPKKRIILRTDKNGVSTVNLAHVDPDLPGFQYTKTVASNVAGNVGLPVELSKTAGNRGTAQPSHFLAAKVPDSVAPMPIPGPEMPLPGPADAPVVPPQPETPATPPEAAKSQIQDSEPEAPTPQAQPKIPTPSSLAKLTGIEGVGPGPRENVPPTPLPPDISKSAPRYGYKDKNFELDFEDPRDKAAYTLGQTKDNAAQAKFLDYLKKQAPDASMEDLKNHALKVRDAVKQLAKNGDPKEGPLKIPSQGGIKTPVTDSIASAGEPLAPQPIEPKVAKAVETPPADVTPLEDKMRPTIGKLLNLKRLRTGEAASYTIDKAIDATRSVTGSGMDPDTQGKVSNLLGETVGPTLTAEQIAKLEDLRGATKEGKPTLEFVNKGEAAKRAASDPNGYLEARNKSMTDMVNALNDPKTTPELAAKITKVLTDPRLSEGHDGNAPDVIYHSEKTSYPKPVDLPADHPEAAFTDKQLGHPITPISTKNYNSIFGGAYKDNILGLDRKTSDYVKPEEQAELDRLAGKTGGSLETSADAARATMKELTGNPETAFGEERGAADKAAKMSPEYRDYQRQLAQRVLDRRIAQMEQELRSKAGQWNNQRPGETPLTKDLGALSPEAKKLLPKELFDEKSSGPTTGSSAEASLNAESATQTPATKKAAASFRPGSETGTQGIKFTKWDAALRKSDPVAASRLIDLHDVVAKEFPRVETRQQIYARASEAYANGVQAQDPFALKKAMDLVATKGEGGFLDLGTGKTSNLLSPESQRAWNAAYADRQLIRWEAMPDSMLKRQGQGLWKGTLQQRIYEASPTSDDLETRISEAEEQADLMERLKTLKEKAAASPHSLLSRMEDWSRGKVESTQAGMEIRKGLGNLKRNAAIRAKTFDSADKLMESLPVAMKDRLYDYTQGGGMDDNLDFYSLVHPDFIAAHELKHGPTGDINDLFDQLRSAHDQAREGYTAQSGNLQDYLLYYKSGQYTNVGKFRALMRDSVGRSPMFGGSDFLKQKVYDSQIAAMEAGLDPVTNNPVRRSLLDIQSLEEATLPYTIRNQYEGLGLASKFDPEQGPPDGWQPLNHPTMGTGDNQYFAPATVAKIYNNFTSRGLAGKWVIPGTQWSLYDAMRYNNNIQNMAQLSFSMFHLSDIVANSALTNAEVATRRLVNEGVFGGRLGKTPTERIQAVGSALGQFAKTPISPIEMYMKGRNVEINYSDPLKQQQYDQLNSDLELTNSTVRPDRNFRLEQLERMKTSWAKAIDPTLPGNTRAWAFTKAAVSALGTIPEASNYLLMRNLIPATKLGALDAMFQQVHREFSESSPDVLNAELTKASDSVDDRFGELNQDNLFWHKSTKDIVGLMARSVGWTLGTMRQLGGAALDIPSDAKSMLTPGAPVHLSPRTAYVATMVAGTMLYNSVKQYLTTGQPAHGVDYFYPKDGTKNGYGEDNRTYPKFLYTYDPINYYHDPLGTFGHKIAPEFATLNDIRRNEDYYHHQIWEPGGKPLDNYQNFFAYLAKGYEPFSVSNNSESRFRGSGNSLGSVFGNMPAPQWVGRSDAENLAYRYFQGTKSSDPMDPVNVEKQKTFLELRNRVNQGTISDDDIQKAVDNGKLQPKMVQYLYQTKIDSDTGKPTTPPIITWLKPLRSESEVWNVWEKATPEEKKTILPMMYEKLSNLASGTKLEEYENQLQDFADKNP
jgi:hypothetical protein